MAKDDDDIAPAADKRDHREIRIRGMGRLLKEDIFNICGHLGVSASEFVKTKLADVVHQYPERYKQPLDEKAKNIDQAAAS